MALSQKKIGIVSGVAVGILICRATGNIALIRNEAHPRPMKKIPGGTIESEETAEDALLREIREETLLKVDEADMNFLFEHFPPIHKHSFLVFVCTIESFNGRVRDEFLNQHLFMNLREAKELAASWREDYNERRPHMALDGLSPNEFKKAYEERLTNNRVA